MTNNESSKKTDAQENDDFLDLNDAFDDAPPENDSLDDDDVMDLSDALPNDLIDDNSSGGDQTDDADPLALGGLEGLDDEDMDNSPFDSEDAFMDINDDEAPIDLMEEPVDQDGNEGSFDDDDIIDLDDIIPESNKEEEIHSGFDVSDLDKVELDTSDDLFGDDAPSLDDDDELEEEESPLAGTDFGDDDLELPDAPDMEGSAFDLPDAEDLDTPEMPPTSGGEIVMDASSLTERQIDEAIERVIRKMIAEKVESYLDDKITSVIQNEMGRIKQALLDALSDAPEDI